MYFLSKTMFGKPSIAACFITSSSNFKNFRYALSHGYSVISTILELLSTAYSNAIPSSLNYFIYSPLSSGSCYYNQ